jgi:hypothetical protein
MIEALLEHNYMAEGNLVFLTSFRERKAQLAALAHDVIVQGRNA